MTREKISLLDTTLRDGAQMADVDFSLADKRHIAALLDGVGFAAAEDKRRVSQSHGLFP